MSEMNDSTQFECRASHVLNCWKKCTTLLLEELSSSEADDGRLKGGKKKDRAGAAAETRRIKTHVLRLIPRGDDWRKWWPISRVYVSEEVSRNVSSFPPCLYARARADRRDPLRGKKNEACWSAGVLRRLLLMSDEYELRINFVLERRWFPAEDVLCNGRPAAASDVYLERQTGVIVTRQRNTD